MGTPPKKQQTLKGLIQLIGYNPAVWKPRELKLIWKDDVNTLDERSSLFSHLRQSAHQGF